MQATRLPALLVIALAMHLNPVVAVPLETHITFEGVVTQRTDWISIPPVITPLNSPYRFELKFVFDPMKDFSTAPSHAAGQYNITADSSPWTFMNSFLSHLGFTVQPMGSESVSGVNVNLYRSDYPQTFFTVASTAEFPSGDPFTSFGAQLLLDDLTAPVSAESARLHWTEPEFTSLLSAAFQNASPFGLYMHVNDRTILDGSVRISALSIVAIPEASTWMLMIVGLCLIFMTVGRQRVRTGKLVATRTAARIEFLQSIDQTGLKLAPQSRHPPPAVGDRQDGCLRQADLGTTASPSSGTGDPAVRTGRVFRRSK